MKKQEKPSLTLKDLEKLRRTIRKIDKTVSFYSLINGACWFFDTPEVSLLHQALQGK